MTHTLINLVVGKAIRFCLGDKGKKNFCEGKENGDFCGMELRAFREIEELEVH